MNIGLLGGSFDPVHNGHLTAAREVLKKFPLDLILLIPAAQAPLKDAPVRASAADRLALLHAATDGIPGLAICDYELQRGGTSYTIDTLRHLHALHPPPGNRLYWIIGADQLPQLPRWRDPAGLACLADFICIHRPGHPLPPPPPIPGLRLHTLMNTTPVDISSTELRARLARGESLDERWLPHNAIEYLRKTGLYRPACPNSPPAKPTRITPSNS
ncbi:nicotinate-nucleotide adenylyltransferase [Geminisphaera colitermitum]|uniref:nicotinate-nucleotide adenylyltransferase n=1 Tax=Geminisphaera colitermitum TaxID=1148786 RepID=UPI000158C5C0|nr:nicotinate-nucleotide adenylyltransferase [Geminisphaera colitermitum]